MRVEGISFAVRPGAADSAGGRRLGDCPRGWRGRVVAVADAPGRNGGRHADLERRLLEMGFVEGAVVEVLHEGPLGRDPIAVRVDGTHTVALRRSDAAEILVEADSR